MPRFDVDAAMTAVEWHRVTHLCCVPPVMIALAKLALSGAAPLGKS